MGQSKQRFHQFSSWVDDAVYQNYLVKPDQGFLKEILPALDKDYGKWESERQLKNGLFWQNDVKDGMEELISGSRKDQNQRPTINSYMYGNAMALDKIAELLGDKLLADKYKNKATTIKKLVQGSLWNASASFFETRKVKGGSAEVREAIGFTPWDFNLPEDLANYAKAWDQLLDTAGFKAPWGLATAERRNPTFRTRGTGHSCEWSAALILEDSPISQYSYPVVIQTADGMLHFIYTWRREKIKHVVVDPSKLKLKKIKNGIWPKLKSYTAPVINETKNEES